MVNIDRVLCAVDFSEFSHHALVHATAIASWYQARLTVLHVHPVGSPPWVLEPATGPSSEALRLSALDRDQLTAELQRFTATAGTGDLTVDFIVDEGDVAAGIVSAAESASAGLIVLGTHGRSGVARLVLGSVTEHVLHLARCPVLVVPPRAGVGSVGPRLFDRILVATDFSDAAASSLKYSLSLAQEANARLTVLHVVQPPPIRDEDEWVARSGGMPSILEAMKASAARQLARAIPASARDWCSITERLEVGRPYREILRIAAEEGVGLVVLGAHGHNVLERVFVGSTAHHVVRRATCPVLAVRAPSI